MDRLKTFVKNEIVLVISFFLCIASMLFVKPTAAYAQYIDIKTLALLFCLMAIMAGLQELGVFKKIAEGLLTRAKSTSQLYIILVLLCFLSSMLITNDVALITFVPFTIITLRLAKKQKHLAYIVVMQTVAANLGSMLTPIGNPQNLYLFSAFNMSMADFVTTIAPYCILSLLLLLAGALFIKKDLLCGIDSKEELNASVPLICLYAVLFVLSLLSVFRILPYQALLLIVVLSLLIFDRKIIAKIDYSLLLTFVFLFVFIGNLGQITAISDFLHNVVNGNEVIVGVLASQVFSNVPACILLSRFTDNARALLVGVNLGGLGTLIASMASLISYKFIQKEKDHSAKYLPLFTAVNLAFLAINLLLYIVIK